MHISGILVRTSPEKVRDCAAALAAFDGLEIDRVDEASASIIVVQETATRQEQEDALRTIQRLPGVAFAELVCHFIDPPEAASLESETLPENHSVNMTRR